MRHRRPGLLYLTRVVLVLALGTAFAGCEALIDLEQRSLDQTLTVCRDYCQAVTTNCAGEQAVYNDRESCLGVCNSNALELGDIEQGDPEGNTIACRARQAELAGTTPQDSADNCIQAGPGGGDRCGTHCESYCALLEATCPDAFDLAFPPTDDCVAECAAFRVVDPFVDFASSDDTLQCRVLELSQATIDPDGHCRAAGVLPFEPCVQPDDAIPSCDDMCHTAMTICTDDLLVYESLDQCLAVCAAMQPGSPRDVSGNTVGCRVYHGYNTLLDAITHCSHVGPGGDGVCGNNCEGYCALLELACPPGPSDCLDACNTEFERTGARPASKYDVGSAASGDTLQCRLLQVARALEAQAFGDPNDREAFCRVATEGGTPCTD